MDDLAGLVRIANGDDFVGDRLRGGFEVLDGADAQRQDDAVDVDDLEVSVRGLQEDALRSIALFKKVFVNDHGVYVLRNSYAKLVIVLDAGRSKSP